MTGKVIKTGCKKSLRKSPLESHYDHREIYDVLVESSYSQRGRDQIERLLSIKQITEGYQPAKHSFPAGHGRHAEISLPPHLVL